MTLQELADYCTALLEEGHNPSAQIRLAHQPTWPFEYALTGACTREDLKDYKADPEVHDLADGDPEDAWCPREEWGDDDVLLMEGSQICYGDADVWEIARTYRS